MGFNLAFKGLITPVDLFFFIAAFEAGGIPPMFIYPTTALSVQEALFKTTTGSRSLLCQFCSILLPCLFKPLNAKFNPICHLLALVGAHPIFHVNRIRVKHIVNTRWKHKYFKGKGLSGTNIVINWWLLVKVTTVMPIVGYYFCLKGECFHKSDCNVF
jgi:hypothetical protein